MLSSKNRFLFLLVTISLTGMVGCSYFFGEKEKETEVTYNGKVGTCITPSNKQLSTYFSAEGVLEMPEESFQLAVDCYQETIDSFVKNTKSGGLDPDTYTAENLFHFLEEFYPDFGMSQDRIASYIYLKGFVFGGESATISKNELMTLHKIIPIVAKTLKNLAPYRKVLLRQTELSRTEEDYERLRTAFTQLKSEFGHLMLEVDEFSGQRQGDLQQMLGFLFQEYFGEEAEDKAKLFPLVLAFKNFVVHDPKQSAMLDRRDLSYFLRQALVAYEAFTQYDAFVLEEGPNKIFTNLGHIASFITRIPSMIRDSSMFKTVALKSIADVVGNIEAVMNYSVRNRLDEKVNYDRVHDIIMGLKHAEMMEEGMATALTTFLKIFGQKWLSPSHQGDSAITKHKIAYIKKLLNEWMRRQQLVNTLFSNPRTKEVSLLELERDLKNHPTLKKWVDALDKVSVHQWDNQARAIYSKNMRNFSYEELTVSNCLLVIGELFMKPYNTNKKRPQNYTVTEANAQEIYNALRVLGVEMAFMDSRIFDSGHRSFMEGNNFSIQKRNDDQLDFYEAYEYLSVAMAAGSLADSIYEDLPDECHSKHIKDVHDKFVTDKPCYDRHMKKNFTKYFDHLPTVKKYWEETDGDILEKFYGTMEVASRAGVITDRSIDLGEIRTFVSVLYYLQATFNMFDANKDGIATGNELVEGESHFRPMIADFLANKNPNIIIDRRELFLRDVCVHVERHTDEKIPYTQSKEIQELAECLAPRLFYHILSWGNLPNEGRMTGAGFWVQNYAPWSRLLNNLGLKDKDDIDFVLKDLKRVKADIRAVARVFSALARITHEAHVDRIFQFFIQKRTDILSSLEADEAPACLEKHAENPFKQVQDPFCDWARQLYCNETVNEEVFKEFADNRVAYFHRGDWEENTYRAAFNSLKLMHDRFTSDHRYFSTHCAFPQIEEAYWTAIGLDLYDAGVRFMRPINELLMGDAEDQGWIK